MKVKIGIGVSRRQRTQWNIVNKCILFQLPQMSNSKKQKLKSKKENCSKKIIFYKIELKT
jgi:hypothetical protein